MKANVQRIALYALTVVGTPALPANTAVPGARAKSNSFRKESQGTRTAAEWKPHHACITLSHLSPRAVMWPRGGRGHFSSAPRDKP